MPKVTMKKLALAVALQLGVVSAAVAVPPAHQLEDLPKLSQQEQHSVVSQRVTTYFTRYHFKNMELDNALSEQILDRYLEMLDYNKMFLLRSDIEQASEYKHLFDDMIHSGKLSPAYSLFEQALKRNYQRYEYALGLLDKEQPFDFTVESDRYHYDREDAQWATTTEELDELWRQRVKYDALNLTMTGKEWPDVVETLEKRYNNALKRLTQTNSEDVFQTVMNAFARSVEAHTSYLSPANAERFEQNMNLSLEGIGAVLQSEFDYTVIRSLVPGGPADKSGAVAPEDKIVAVAQGDDEDAEFVDIVGWRLDEVVELIKGPKGTTVQLQVLKANQAAGAKPSEISIVRDEVKLEDRAAKVEIKTMEEGPYAGRSMGVITIPSFYHKLSDDVKKLIQEVTEADAEGVIIDLRGNGGGSLQESIALTGLFIDEGPVVQVTDGSGRREVNGDRDGETFYGGPLVVMVDRYSASASEIFAAALQDYERALIVGENTYGKGTVQQHRGLQRRFDFFDEPLGSVQYTIAKFYRINGGSTQMKGVRPDVAFPTVTDPETFGESSQENALPWDKIDTADYRNLEFISANKLAELNALKAKNVKQNPEFKYVLEDAEKYQQEKDKTWVSLVLAEREAEDQANEDKALARTNERLVRAGFEAVDSLDDVPEEFELPDPYLNETLVLSFELIDTMKLAMH
ncbi:Tail-specific protease [Pseudidiomarina piscicola]|uniref:Tail-specific protease n=1 Tax=Pseudidiomarina piscicola TaxID=2614830 RepID=A0A6S6WQI0_9GAMM|nr:carboxy terminal-processing peptidase [Pseudidiomarina piscicola]CAB0149974.1 Tail-specific protease [Pseudidiomarina piscicola]VZT39420.1 Tail-specific protease [Pseudomonas aeruginosa]